MFSSVKGMVAGTLFVAAIVAFSSSDRSGNYKPAKASVYLIDRSCNFTETTTDPDGRTSARGITDSCNSTDEWAKVRKKRDKVVSGKATVHVEYVAPQDGQTHTAELQFTGRDDEFYDLKAGDQIDVLVRNDNLDKVTKA